ncbi:hypothetical protein BDV34DRAFT_3578 [Aspergillus parasiticus]|uniref:Uncharacterized protein n=1 Tax=Aspergillus parasiticus TaxID=5067 RepID=A0A5N6E567_ASPPA|nr:hypothetical protein BDV34DRAFT_3578 [Aspergillus parasiticus]
MKEIPSESLTETTGIFFRVEVKPGAHHSGTTKKIDLEPSTSNRGCVVTREKKQACCWWSWFCETRTVLETGF